MFSIVQEYLIIPILRFTFHIHLFISSVCADFIICVILFDSSFCKGLLKVTSFKKIQQYDGILIIFTIGLKIDTIFYCYNNILTSTSGVWWQSFLSITAFQYLSTIRYYLTAFPYLILWIYNLQ